MESATARIPAHSRRQAMDWSLVLASQGIEAFIEEIPETAQWGLLVPPADLERALQAIHLYRLENRRWPWRHDLLEGRLPFDWTSLAWAFLLGIFFLLSEGPGDWRGVGSMDSVAVTHGQWWRLFTAIWLHADAAHLATNAGIGILLLGLVMGRYGPGLGLLSAYLAGAGGNVIAGWLSVGPHLALGASGMVMACLGLLAVQSFWLWRQTPAAPKLILTGLLGGVFLFLLLGLSPGTDIQAHFGGFVCGLLLGGLAALFPRLAQNPRANLLAGLLFALLVIWPWWLALRH